ncbi:hypothetical protein MVEN_02588700 [Mycena venus]|uniref:Uncharacterized protein n=1 Tax=Mycena venus TaxID=2733690 RepID=A0A8H6U120_9AGAR|nr:hypothetical protein MVEN_02588700 [Mycena venus]
MYLFSHICLRLSRANPSPFEPFLDLVEALLVPIPSFVRSLEIRLLEGEVSAEHIDRLCESGRNTYAVDHPEGPIERENRTRFQHQLLTHISRFGASLTHFEMGFPSDLEIHLIMNLICALPFLTHLKICGGDYAIIQSETVPMTAAFPPSARPRHLDGRRWKWLLLHSQPPIFTSLRITGKARGISTVPIEAYIQRFGPAITTLTLEYWADNLADINAFRMHALASTPGLVNFSLTCELPTTVPSILSLLSSPDLASLEISLEAKFFGLPDWLRIDEILAVTFLSLHRVLFTLRSEKISLAPEIRALMPQSSAREILV